MAKQLNLSAHTLPDLFKRFDGEPVDNSMERFVGRGGDIARICVFDFLTGVLGAGLEISNGAWTRQLMPTAMHTVVENALPAKSRVNTAFSFANLASAGKSSL
mmetsp:Transcript_87547/g.160370  ORF Transcript_87547/g.160370 Transcript_87547/m.160370 type:complete len:103 (+) Transcript_87547:192-500(+)